MQIGIWWCRICHRYLRDDEVRPVPSPVDRIVNHSEILIRYGQPHKIRHTVERRMPDAT